MHIETTERNEKMGYYDTLARQNPDKLTPMERARLTNWQERQERQEAFNAAHDRFMQNRAHSIEADPNSVSPQERRSTLDYMRQREAEDRMRAHERGMLRDRIRGDVRIAEEKHRGMEGQGMEAARVNAEASMRNADQEATTRWYLADKEAEWRMHGADQDAAMRREAARMGLEGEKYKADRQLDAAEAQHGYHDTAGNYHPGGNAVVAATQERIAAAQQAAAAAAQQRTDGLKRQQMLQNEMAKLRQQYKDKTQEELLAMARRNIAAYEAEGSSALDQFERK